MPIRSRLAVAALALLPAVAAAQHGGASAAPPAAPREASQFDFLIGAWTLDVRPVVSGLAAAIHGAPRFTGTLRAWRALDGFGIEDEIRITDASGNPRAFTHATHLYDASGGRWIGATMDVFRATIGLTTGEWKEGRMTIIARSTDASGAPVLTRTTYTDITRAGFRFRQERSADDGKTWKETLTVTATTAGAGAAR